MKTTTLILLLLAIMTAPVISVTEAHADSAAEIAKILQNPLAPPDTSSPRATLKSFQGIMGEYGRLLKKDIHTKTGASELRDELFEDKAMRCLDLRNIPKERVEDVGNDTIAILQEILDRIVLPRYKDIPDAAAVQDQKLSSWTIPYTEITIAKIKEGPLEGKWLFSSETIARSNEFFKKVKDLPYRPDAIVGEIRPQVGLYEYQVYFPEESFPSEWIDELPDWLTAVYFEHPLWKWVAIILVLLSGILIFVLILRLNRRIEARQDKDKGPVHWQRLLLPAFGWGFAKLADELIDEQLNAVGLVDSVIEIGLWTMSLICLAWFIVTLAGIVAKSIARSSRLKSKKVNTYLVSITLHILSLIIAVWIVVDGLEDLGVSLMPLLAGLGVGGFAIALAVRPTLENFIGGIILFLDKPVNVGDICSFGDQIGFVESIGIRTTRIRKYEDTVVSIPNAEFSQMQLENLSARERTLFQVILALRYETTAEQLRYALTKLRKMLIGHPKVSAELLRVRLLRFGDSSLDIEVFAYIRTNDYPEYWAIREDLNLRIMDIVKEAGTGFAFPSQTTYFSKDTGLNAEKSRGAEAQVEDWRTKGKLPFPEFDEEGQMEFEDILDYPPTGSPHQAEQKEISEINRDQKTSRTGSRSSPAKRWSWKR
jgi:MscS family membrane protein